MYALNHFGDLTSTEFSSAYLMSSISAKKMPAPKHVHRLKDVPEEARTGMKQTIAALRGVIAGKGAFKNAKKA